MVKNNTVVVARRHLDSMRAYCENNSLKHQTVEENKKQQTVSLKFNSAEEAVEADKWNQNLHRFDKLEGELPS